MKYTTVSISEPLMKRIKDHIEGRDDYVSAGDFVRKAVIEQMQREFLP